MKYFILISFLFISLFSFSQEQLVPLAKNPSLLNAKQVINPKTNTKGSNSGIKLPFIDDFSRSGYYPYTDLWEDSYVFINRSLAVNPPSIGVATFDAMNNKGKVYSGMSTYPSKADTLTSRAIRLDSSFITNSKLTPADSVYLSFYVQPQGMGDMPQSDDSLVLEFYHQSKDKWVHIWAMEGMALDTLKARYGVDFLRIMIPIKDTIFFGPQFKFRFTNYASIPSNNIPSWQSGLYDHWNLDYILLDAKRTYNDIYTDDVSISGKVTTLLKNYQSMPWNQFQANSNAEMDHSKDIEYKRHDQITGPINVAQYFGIYDLSQSTTDFHPNPNPASTNMTTSSLIFAPAYSGYTYTATSSPYADFKVEFQVLHTPDIIRSNDTLKFIQRFYNYYSYDDGVPEAGYGLSNTNAQLAVKFHTNIADSIQSVQFYFNQTLNAASQQYFDIQIYDNNGGAPGNVIYSQKSVRPEYEEDLFKFHTYVLSKAVAVNGTFYVGWKQLTQDNLNVGWDYNNENQDKIFYNVTGNWYASSFKGTTMIRPIMGTEDQAYVGIAAPEKESNFTLNIFPNPVENGILQLQIKSKESINQSDYRFRIYNMSGQLMRDQVYQNQIDVSSIPAGIYLIQLYSVDGNTFINKKFIINN